MSEYYLADGGQRRGPFPIEQLRAQGLTADTLVWREGMANWERAEDVIEVRPYLPAPGADVVGGHPQEGYPQPGYANQGYDPHYGQPISYHGPQYGGQSHSGMAIAGFVLSFVLPLLGLIFSWIALSGMKRTGNEENKGLAIAGLVISIVLCSIGLLYCIGIMTCFAAPWWWW
jgi:hypothetical protein